MKHYSFKTLDKIVTNFKEGYLKTYICNISIINSRDLLFSFSIKRKEKLLVSLSHNMPFISFVEVDDSYPTILGTLNDNLRKEIKDGQIQDIKIINNDRIVEITIIKSNDYFDKETKYLIFEIIPHRSNLILLNSEREIIFALHYTSLESYRPILKGMKYHPYEKVSEYTTDDCEEIEVVKSFAKEYLFEARLKRMKEKYDYLFKYLKTRIKSLNNKINVLKSDLQKASSNLIYQEHGNMLLALINYPHELQNYLIEMGLVIDEKLTIGQQADLYFKKYKKAKRTIEMNSLEVKRTLNEIEKLLMYQNQIQYMNEEDLYELALELLPHKVKIDSKKKNKSTISYVMVNNIKIFFGKNAKQNDELTFSLSKKEDYCFHIKDYHGAHILAKIDHFDKEVFLLASEITLLLSNKESGEIMYTQIKNVKKGNTLGKVNLLEYETIKLNSVRHQSKEILKNHF